MLCYSIPVKARVRQWNPSAAAVRRVLLGIPPLEGRPLAIEGAAGLGARRGPVHAGSFVRERRIAFDCTSREFPRIFVHEIFHFVWVRLGNPKRIAYERLLAQEIRAGARGELGWSAERRKRGLRPEDAAGRGRRWREYCCESFCDTAAWLYAGIRRHAEFTLARRCARQRAQWFAQNLGSKRLSI